MQELQFICTALPLDEMYPRMKYHKCRLYSFHGMHVTKIKYENKQRAITKKLSKAGVTVSMHCPPP